MTNKMAACFMWMLISASIFCESSTAESQTERVITRLRHISDPDVLPMTSDGKPVEVTLSLSLVNIAHVDLHKNEVDVFVWQTLSWPHLGLVWKPAEFGNVTSVSLPRKYVWTPDITVYNGLMRPEELSPDLVIVTSDGQVTQLPNRHLRLLCDVSSLDITGGALCTIKLGSWTYDGSQMTLREPTSESLDMSGYFAASSYMVVGSSARKNVMYYSCCTEPYEDIQFDFTFQRREMYDYNTAGESVKEEHNVKDYI